MLMHAFDSRDVYVLAPFAKQLKGIEKYKEIRDVESRQMTSYNGQMDVLSQEAERQEGSVLLENGTWRADSEETPCRGTIEFRNVCF